MSLFITVRTVDTYETTVADYCLRDSGYVYCDGMQMVGSGGATVLLRPDLTEDEFFGWVKKRILRYNRNIKIEMI